MQQEQQEQQANAAANTKDLVERFWSLMASNHFASVAEVCSDALVVEWPQSRERFVGIENFAKMNHEYTAHGPWQFEIRRLVADQQQAVTEVAITDGVQRALAISFFAIEAGLITHILEFWPEPFAAPSNRAHLAEVMKQDSA